MLTSLGLDTDTESVYRALLAHPDDGVAGLGNRLGLPPDAVRRGLDQLSELALVRPSYDDPGRLRTVSPDVGMELLLTRQQAELAAQQQRIEASRAAAAQLIADYADLRPATAQPGVEQLVGLDEIRDRLARLTRTAREEIMTFAGGHHSEHAIAAAMPLDEDLSRRGLRTRTVYLDSARNSPHTLAYLQWLAELGTEVRTVATLPTRMVMYDRTAAVIPVKSDDTAAGAVILTGDGTLAMLCALFESTWDSAQPLSTTAHRDTRGLTSSEATALKLLADGHTEEAVAKRLGVSHRTARRIATTLMEVLGARSRFEAGARAAQRGWL
ncbi:helix-turn-helix transcriptional regulator [Streptomyces sp. NPDC051940]|uniref:helix-turn-helix transcriptional regulator n=1 Tax=Streptomyces sp. NPDC051940 TaxID=3155675 RepID=UPI0034418F5C